MDESELLNAFKAVQQNAKRISASSEQRKGQRTASRPHRDQLELQLESIRFSYIRRSLSDHKWIRQAIIGSAYAPSKIELDQLKPILVSDLLLETHHLGKVLVARTCFYPGRIVAVQSVIEDKAGQADRLAVYNIHPSVEPDEVLPKGEVFAIKEPYYKLSADGQCSVRVDHPCDLIQLIPGHNLIPPEWQTRTLHQTAEGYKLTGNEAIKRKDHGSAYRSYSLALEQNNNRNVQLQQDLFRNRAQACLLAGKFEQCLRDCEAAMISGSEQGDSRITALNMKALYRAGSAAYALRSFTRAQEFFEQALALDPQDKDAQRELARTQARLNEETSGQYNFDAMASKQQHGKTRVDRADYISRTAVRQTSTRGRGLFATVDIPAGDIVFCEKAFDVAFKSDQSTDFFILLNVNTNCGSAGAHVTLLQSVVKKMSLNPGVASHLLKLYDGNHGTEPTCDILDDRPVIDTFQVQRIAEYNAFGCDGLSANNADAPTTAAQMNFADSTGIWIHASYMNHDCIGNVMRAFVGDMMIVRATRAITKDEELLIQYKGPDSARTGVEQYKSHWGFTCTCALCTAENATDSLQQQERKKRSREMKKFLDGFEISQHTVPSKAALSRGKQLHAKLVKTYDSNLYAKLPRVGLLDFGLRRCQAYSILSMQKGSLESAQALLHEMGMTLVQDSKIWKVQRRGGCIGTAPFDAVDAAMYASQACLALGNKTKSQAFEALAKQLYLECMGSSLGFDKRYN